MKFDHPFCSRCGAPAAALLEAGTAENEYKRIKHWLQFNIVTKVFNLNQLSNEADMLDASNEVVIECHLGHIWEAWAQ